MLGVLLNYYAAAFTDRIKPALPIVSILAIALVIGIVVGLNQSKLAGIGLMLTTAVAVHNLSGLAAGYGLAKMLGFDQKTRRTMAIEVGMQNSGLAVAIAIKHFSALAAVPGALFSVIHNITGSVLAGYWATKTDHPDNS